MIDAIEVGTFRASRGTMAVEIKLVVATGAEARDGMCEGGSDVISGDADDGIRVGVREVPRNEQLTKSAKARDIKTDPERVAGGSER